MCWYWSYSIHKFVHSTTFFTYPLCTPSQGCENCLVCFYKTFLKLNNCVGFYKKWNNFQQRISWLSHRWRTQRIAICNVNCRIQWIIESLNAHCTLWYSGGYACLSVIFHPQYEMHFNQMYLTLDIEGLLVGHLWFYQLLLNILAGFNAWMTSV